MTIHPPRGCLCLICMSSQSRNFFGGVSQGCFSPLLVCQLDSCLASPADHTFSRPRCGSVPRPQQKHVGRSLRRRQLTRHGACAGATREGDAPSVPKYHRTSASAVVLPPVRTARTNAQRGATSARARVFSSHGVSRTWRALREVPLDPSRVRFLDTLTLTLPRLPISSVSTVHARGRRGGWSWLRGGDGHLHRSGVLASRAVRASSPARAPRSTSPRDRPSRVVTPRLRIGFLFVESSAHRDPDLTSPPSPFRLVVQKVSLRRTHNRSPGPLYP